MITSCALGQSGVEAGGVRGTEEAAGSEDPGKGTRVADPGPISEASEMSSSAYREGTW